MNRFIVRALALGLAAALLGCSAADTPDASPLAQVTTQPLQQGDLPHIVSAYGSSVPANDASYTVSVQAMGRVAQWLVAPGASVRQGQLLGQFALAPSAVSAYAQASSAVRVAAETRAHVTALLAQQLATRDQLAQADKALSDAQTTLAALRRDQGDTALSDLRAPSDGQIASIDATRGDVLAAGTPLLTLIKRNGWVATVGLEPADQHDVHAGDSADLVSIESSQHWLGRVLSVGQVPDAHTHQLPVLIASITPLTGNTALRADIHADSWHGWLVPRDAVIGDSKPSIYQLNGELAHKVSVNVIGGDDHTTVVLGAIDPKQPLIVTGADQLDDGMHVQIDQAKRP